MPDPRLVAVILDAVGKGAGRRPLVLGLCGAQGSGKTTLARAVAMEADRRGLATASLSIDDLYRTRAERERLSREFHPLLITRGVPGTHDVALGLEALAALDRGEPAPLPRFDKARDDRLPAAEWGRAPADAALVILEGWCVGARPESAAALRDPVNALEASEDADGRWRRHVNRALAGAYQDLFARIDVLVLLAAPGFEVVADWRAQQEADLRARVGADAPGLMDDAGITRFVAHYERLTRHILREMPARADLVVRLGRDRSVLAIT